MHDVVENEAASRGYIYQVEKNMQVKKKMMIYNPNDRWLFFGHLNQPHPFHGVKF